MTKANIFKYGIAALLLLANVNIHAAILTTTEKADLEKRLDILDKQEIPAATKVTAQTKTFEANVALAKKYNERNNIKRKLAGRA